jgi:hypothetical protein
MEESMTMRPTRSIALAAAAALLLAGSALAHDPEFTSDFDRDRCTFTTTGSNPYFPLWPGYALLIEGEEEDEGEILEISSLTTVLFDTELVDGVRTRVVEERESEDGELAEVSRNFMAYCRETGDVWYFGEDVDNYEDGEIVNHDGSWRAGVDGATPGIIMLGTPAIGARYQQEDAPGVAEDRGEVVSRGEVIETPAGTFDRTLGILDTDALEPGEPGDPKFFAFGVGQIVDEELELTEITPPPCLPDATAHCLSDGRFRVTVEWETDQGTSGLGQAILPSDDSGEFWFFNPDNTELIVKVLNACDVPEFNRFWVFAAGLTNVGVRITVVDTGSPAVPPKVYENPVGQPFTPVLDTNAFATCP